MGEARLYFLTKKSVAGRTNLVTTDSSGRIVDFEIQEGKGDLSSYIVKLGKKWQDEWYRYRFRFLTVKVTVPQIGWAYRCGERLSEQLECVSCGRKFRKVGRHIEEIGVVS